MDKVKILIVEDEGIIAKDVKNRLRAMGYTVPAVASSGADAIQKAEELRPDLVLMDIVLPGEMDGVEVAAHIQAHLKIPVIYLTAYADAETLQRAKAAQPFGYVLKPFDDRELQICIEMALYKHSAEAKLRESEQWFATTLRSIGDAVIATDGKGRVTFMNPVAEALTGWSQEEAHGKRLTEVFKIINEQTHKRAENPRARVLREGVVVGLANHTILINKEGREIPIDDSGAPIRDDAGNVTGVVLVFRDITERRRAEAAVAQERALLHALMDNIPDHIYFKDAQSRFTRINKAKGQTMGLPAEAVLGKTDFDFYAPSFAQEASADEQEILRTGQPLVDKVEEVVAADGTSFWVSATKGPILDEEQRVTGIVGISRDITERKRAEEALARSEERFRLLAENAQDIVFRFRLVPSPGFEYVSPAIRTITGYTPEEFYADPALIFRVVHPEDRELHERATRSPDETPQPLLLRVIRRDGGIIWTEQKFISIHDRAGTVVAIEGIARDVTERNLAEDALLSSEEQFRQIVQQMPYPTEVCAPNGTTVMVNPAFLELFGIESADRVIGQRNILKEPLVDQLGLRETIARAYEGATVFVPELLIPLENVRSTYGVSRKETIVLEVTMFPVFHPTGGIRQVVTICKNITERKRIEEERKAFARLATRLAGAATEEEVAAVVREESEPLVGWDACFLAVRRTEDDSFRAISFVDTIAGEKKTFPGQVWPKESMSEAGRQVLEGRPLLINRRPDDPGPPGGRFGDLDRPSASLMFAPVRSGETMIGVLSAQSYTPRRYGEADLETLQRIADAVAPALERAHVEAVRRESEARLHTALECLPFDFWILDPEQRCVMQNTISRNIWGDMIGKLPAATGVEERVLARWDRDNRRALSGEVIHTESEYAVRKEKRTYHSILAPIVDRDQIRGLLGVNIDITDRKRAAEALRETNEMLHAMIQASPLAIMTLAPEGKVTLWNPAAERMFGWSEPEVLGRLLPFVPEANFSQFHELRTRVLGGEAFTGMELRRRKKDGSPIDISLSTAPLRDAQGNVTGILALIADITERKRAEEELRLKAQLLDNAMDSIFLHDLDGNFIYVNEAACRSHGYGREEFMRLNLHELDVPEYEKLIAARLDVLMKVGETTFESGHFRKDETIMPVDVHARLIESGGRRLVLSATRDITERKRAEAALRQSEMQYRTTMNSLADAVHVVDRDLRVVLLNTTFRLWCAELGSRTDGLQQSILELFPFLPETVREEYRQVFESGKPLFTEERSWVGGREIITETRKIPVFEEGKVVRIVTVIRDVTEKKRAEEALRESQARFQELFDDAPVGYHELDTEGRITRINHTELAMLGYQPEEILGHPIWDIVADADVSRQAFAAKIAGTMPPGKAFERTFRRKDGTTFPVLVSERLLHDEAEQIVGLRITNQDISERKRAQEALQESEAKFRGLAETVPAMIFIVRGDRFLYVNPASQGITGYRRDELLAMDIFDLCHPDSREMVKARSRARQEGQDVPPRYELEIVRKDGEVRWLDFAASRIEYEGTTAVLGTAYDITERKHADDALREALARFESVIEKTPLVAIQGLDGQGMIRHWNDASEWLYGFSAAEAVGKRFQDFMLPPEAVAQFERDLAGIWKTSQPTPPQQSPIRNRRGDELWVYSTMFPIFEKGQVVEVFSMDVDVTEQVRAEKALHHRLAFENLIATISTNFLTLALEQIDRGISSALEALGDFMNVDRSYVFLFHEEGTMSNTHEWCAEGIESPMRRLQRLPMSRFPWHLDKIRQLEIVHVPRVSDLPPEAAPEKEEFQLEGIQSLILLPLVYRGTTIGFFGFDSVRKERTWPEDSVALLKMVGEVFVNALEHKRVEEMERHSRSVTEAIATAGLRYLETGNVRTMAQIIVEQATHLTDARAGIVVDLDADRNPRLLAVSSKTWELMHGGIFDRARHELTTEGFFPLFLGENLLSMALRKGQTVLTNTPAEHPHWVGRKPEGHPPIDSFLATPIKVGDEVLGMIALANRPGGFTEREQREAETFANTAALALRMARSEQERQLAEEQLRQALKMEAVGRLAGGIAHDFNNLLTAIIGYADLGIHSVHPAEPVRRCFVEIQSAANRAAGLTHQLLAFSRRQPLEPRVVSLNDILLDMGNMLRRLIGEDVELVTPLAANLGAVQVDPTQLEQVIVNLAINARDAMPSGGRLTIETTNVTLDEDYAHAQRGVASGDYVLLAVTDTGTGMTDEVKAHLFEPFFTTKEVGKGTGLGLATCYGIVKQSGGHITAYSEPGLGTTFKVYLPRVAETPAALPQRDEAGYLPPGDETILLVEDEEAVRTLSARVLRELGYTLLEAAHGEEALRVVREHAGQPLHLLVTDVVMPQMGGKALAERLRAAQPDLKVLFMSGYSDNGILHLGLTEHGTAYLQKPFTPGVLARKIRDTLDVAAGE